MPDYTAEDLRTVAVQSATGSGKTLVMHAHILQYRRIAGEAGKAPRNVILVTPNEQLSEQHDRELRASNLSARIFSSEAGADLLRPVEIVDVNKLAEKQGVKRVAVRDFGDNNLVLVDEGHLGASGKVWRERRSELAEGGFTFEYSATFNQIVGRDDALRDAYGKSLLFDYPYRAFHADGYGKDYAIANLPQGAEDENSRFYLLGALLSFYRQCRIWREGRAGWTEFNVTRPLWVFLGKTVTGNTNADRATRSDVVLILDFLGWVLARGGAVRPMLARLLAGESGLTGEDGRDYFADRFKGLEGEAPGALYDDICQTLFRGAGRLHVRYLTQGEGELHLRTADNEPFGVVNVGDSAALHKLLSEGDHPDLVVEPRGRLRPAAVRGGGPGGLDRERRDRRAALHRRLELLARERDGAHACRRRRGAGNHPDVRTRRALQGPGHEPQAPPLHAGRTARRHGRADGTGDAAHLRPQGQLHADLPANAGDGRHFDGAGGDRTPRRLELRKAEAEDRPAQGRAGLCALG